MDFLYMDIADEMGEFFSLSNKEGFDSYDFIKKFMLSDTCRKMDRPYDHLQFAGEAYLMETFLEEMKGNILKSNDILIKPDLYWIGYIYRYWNFYTNESSREIYKQADAETMYRACAYYAYLYEEKIIDNLKEDYKNKQKQPLWLKKKNLLKV